MAKQARSKIVLHQDKGKSVSSLVLGIISLGLSFIPFVGIICGALAIVKHNAAMKMIRLDPRAYGGSGMATAGYITGILGIVFGVLMLFVWIVYLIIIIKYMSIFTSGPVLID